jgi:hypothetical protein
MLALASAAVALPDGRGSGCRPSAPDGALAGGGFGRAAWPDLGSWARIWAWQGPTGSS